MKPTNWNFDHSYLRLPETFYSRTSPTPVKEPSLLVYNRSLAKELGLEGADDAEVLAGNTLPEGAEPLAQAYAGHQFGHFTMLGDGRAVLLGEQLTPDGTRFDVQLKGAGRTPYSRGGDGRATLGPMLREYLISEAMHGLGIPTTRSLAVTATGEIVIREEDLPGAVLTRIAASHLRVGTFQYAYKWKSKEDVKALADYAIERHYPELTGENRYLEFYRAVMANQAYLIAQWQLVGFIHGVMNTDNMTISGETIDYGPCAFMDTYDPDTVFSSIDIHGRYAYKNQPNIGAWNLSRFGEALLPLIHDDQDLAVELAQSVLDDYKQIFKQHLYEGMRHKIGLASKQDQDIELINELLSAMTKYKADYTHTFRSLTLGERQGMVLFQSREFSQWERKWRDRLEQEGASDENLETRMKKANPSVIPRNQKVEEALEAAVHEGDLSVFQQLLKVLQDPYAYSGEEEAYAELPKPSDQPYRTFCGT